MEDGLDDAAGTASDHLVASAAQPGRRAKARPSRPAALEPDVPDELCANCETELAGPVCHECGQLADEYHRPARGLVTELVESALALDGRVARTIPNLLFRPGRITRAYLKGQRVRFMPPFRLYIIASLIFFLLAPNFDRLDLSDGTVGFSDAMRGANISQAQLQGRIEGEFAAAVAAGEMTPEEAAEAQRALSVLGLASPPQDGEAGVSAGGQAPASSEALASDQEGPDSPVTATLDRGAGSDSIIIGPGGDPDQIRAFFAPEDFGEAPIDSIFSLPVRRYLGDRFAEVTEDPGGWAEAAAAWAPRIMFVMVPVYALLLSLVYAWRRRFFFFDHLIVSMHFHSALFLVMSLGLIVGGAGAFLALLLYSNIYLYRLNRVVYARGRFSSILRTMTLDVLYFIVLLFGFIAVLLLGALAG